ncbi:MAG: beta-propeller domain-containing protein [Ruminococcus sp.]|nr:beta-propeller domain-containing protein [Ruminococcus sp.]
MNNNEFNDLDNIFNSDIPLPESLSKENMVKMLKENKEAEKHKIKLFPKIVSAAAAFAIVAVSTFCVRTYNDRMKQISAETYTDVVAAAEANNANASHANAVSSANSLVSASTNEPTYAPLDVNAEKHPLSAFSSEAELQKYLEKLHKDDVKRGTEQVKNYNTGTTMAAAAAPMAPDTAADAAKSESMNFSQTNTQVNGVDEADIVKNDGRYLYIIADNVTLSIVDTQTMKTVYTKAFSAKDSKKTLLLDDMYLIANKLVLIGYEMDKMSDTVNVKDGVIYTTSCCYAWPIASDSVSIMLDISDKSNITEIKRNSQSGSIVSTRMIGSVLYVVTRYAADVYDRKSLEENSVPKINGSKLTHNEIYRDASKKDMGQYVIVSAFDTAKENEPIGKLAVLGDGDEVYCTENKLYLTSSEYDERAKSGFFDSTEIYALSLNGTDITYVANGTVNGTINNQYSIDEYNGYLRIATTAFTDKSEVSCLYVLDANLNVIGKLEDIAKDERIKSSRFIGDTAYIVTFRNTDPLFAIDLSNPASPKILGEVKLPGFSEYLHPVGNNLLVGVGYSGDENSADMNSVKVSLFDISDKTNPKELDSHIIKNAGTDVNYDAKAFLYYPERDLVGIPIYYDVYDSKGEWKSSSNQFKFLQIENGKFTEKQNFTHPTENDYGTPFFRGSYIGDMLYTISPETVIEHSITSGRALRTATISK